MHSCWTKETSNIQKKSNERQNSPSEGCSKPRSLIARSNSGFNRKSLCSCQCEPYAKKRETDRKPVEWIPEKFFLSLSSSAIVPPPAAIKVAPFGTTSFSSS